MQYAGVDGWIKVAAQTTYQALIGAGLTGWAAAGSCEYAETRNWLRNGLAEGVVDPGRSLRLVDSGARFRSLIGLHYVRCRRLM